MDRLDALRTFVAVAAHRSFSSAARQLHISAAAASRAVSGLEDQMGVALLLRTTRSVTLTAEGALFAERCRQALETIADAELAVKGDNGAPAGPLVINAPVVVGRLHILPIVARLLEAHPKLSVRLTLNDHNVRLAEEGVDIAVRVGELTDSALIAVRLLDVYRQPVASPAYLARKGVPQTPQDLHDHDLIGFDGFALGDEWRFGGDMASTVRFTPRLITNSVDAAVSAAILGLGIARPLSYQVEHAIALGQLVPVLQDFSPASVPINLLYLAGRRTSPNVRAMIEVAQDYFKARSQG